MTRQFSSLALIGFAFVGTLVLSAQSSDQTPSPAVMKAVEAAFPQNLRYAGEPPSEDPYGTCAAVFSRDADGAPSLIAAAYSGRGAEVAMLAYNLGEVRIIDAVNDRQLGFDGGSCDASIVNLADPAQHSSLLARTVEISFGGQDWFLLWDGKKLHNITALFPGSGLSELNILPDSYMHTTNIVDIDHSGAMQIVGNNGDWDKFPKDDGISSTGTDILFRYNGTTYALAKAFLYLEEYEPNLPKSHDDLAIYKIDAPPWTHAINMHRTPASSYHLKIVNGDRDGGNRVSSAKVEINGVTIVLPTEVNDGVETLTRTIQLQKENVIKVTVDGPEKSHLCVTVE